MHYRYLAYHYKEGHKSIPTAQLALHHPGSYVCVYEMQYNESALELISEKFFQTDLVSGILLQILPIDPISVGLLSPNYPQIFLRFI